MTPLTAVKIHVSVFEDPQASSCYQSYTLENTPFYFKPVWSNNSEKINYSQYQIIWDFGDGTTSTGPSAAHTYQYPGIYNFKATFFDVQGNTESVFTTTDSTTAGEIIALTAYNALPDKIVFAPFKPNSDSGLYLLPAGIQSQELELYRFNSWQNDELLKKYNYTINLYASGSRSDFLSLSTYYLDKWAHLRAYFGFVETYVTNDGIISSKLVDSTSTDSVSVFAQKNRNFDWSIGLQFFNYKKANTSFAGTTGTSNTNQKTIRFVDQRPNTNNPNSVVFVFAGPNTRAWPDYYNVYNSSYAAINSPEYGYINTDYSTQYLKSIFNPAQSLSITSNGITVEGNQQTLGPLTGQLLHSFNLYPIKWVTQKIPFVVTFKDKNNFTTKCYPPVSGFTTDGTGVNSLYVVDLKLIKYSELDPLTPFVPVSTYKINEAVFTQNNNAPKLNNSGSYFCGILEMPYETKTVAICASILVKDQPPTNLGFSYGFAGQPGIKSIKRFRRRPIFSYCNSENLELSFAGENTTITTAQTASMPISIAPLKSYGLGEEDKVWIADGDEDLIYVYNFAGTQLNRLALSSIPVYVSDFVSPVYTSLLGSLNAASPSSIAIDSKGHAWITLFDAVSCIKISTETYSVVSKAVPILENTQYTNTSVYTSLSGVLSGFAGENSLLPGAVDTDSMDNIWVGYSHPVSGFVIKYDENGNQLFVIPIPPGHSIQELVVDGEDNIYAIAVNYNNIEPVPYNRIDRLYKWNNNGNLLAGFPLDIKCIGNITFDENNNVWISHEYSKVSRLTSLNTLQEFTIGNQTPILDYTQTIGGIATDQEGYLWIIQNMQGKILFFPTTNPQQTNINDLEYGELPDIEKYLPEGVQAFYSVMGDWTGSRWGNKYYKVITPDPRIISGTSNLFDILNNYPVVNKINENFDQTAQFKKYILQESLFDKTRLLDNFLGQIVGNVDSPPETLGKEIYEKISNFVGNISDPEVCNINSLESLYNQYGLTFNKYVGQYPSKLKRAIDILSINQSKLFGTPNFYSRNFGLSSLGYQLGKNLGVEIPISTGKFVVGDPVVAYEKFSEIYSLITNTIVPQTNGLSAVVGQLYPLSGVNYNWGWNLVTGTKEQSGVDIDPYYIFYEYTPYYPKNMVDGIIDFNNPLTTISPYNSGYEDWKKTGGTMDIILSRAFAEGLKII